MRLYTADLDKLTFDDVKKFVELRIKENQQIEYKSYWPKKPLANWLCAFANSSGGILLLGVEADENEKPTNICGIQIDKASQDNVDSEAWRVTPPLFGLVETSPPIPLPDNPSKAVFVIRVDTGMSDTPFNVDGVAYIRTDGSTRRIIDPELKRVGLATPDEFIALIKRRDAATELRKELIEGVQKSRKFVGGMGSNFVEIAIIPEFPKPLYQWIPSFEFERMSWSDAAIKIDGKMYPFGQQGDTTRVQGGCRHIFHGHRYVSYLFSHRSGLFYNSRGIEPWLYEKPEAAFENGHVFNAKLCLRFLFSSLGYAAQLYRAMNFYGNLYISMNVENVLDREIEIEGSYTSKIRDPRLTAEWIVSSACLMNDPIAATGRIFEELLYVTNEKPELLIQDALKNFSLFNFKDEAFFENGEWTQLWKDQ